MGRIGHVPNKPRPLTLRRNNRKEYKYKQQVRNKQIRTYHNPPQQNPAIHNLRVCDDPAAAQLNKTKKNRKNMRTHIQTKHKAAAITSVQSPLFPRLHRTETKVRPPPIEYTPYNSHRVPQKYDGRNELTQETACLAEQRTPHVHRTPRDVRNETTPSPSHLTKMICETRQNQNKLRKPPSHGPSSCR